MKIFLVAGEMSGDHLGGGLMAALSRQLPHAVFSGVGGRDMAAHGLMSLFPMSDLSVMGIGPVLARLPLLIRRIRETARAIIETRPDVVVMIDSPDFTHRVARKVRAARPEIPIVFYVAPTVWAWRPQRARAMRPYADLLMALLPFEPAAMGALGGPETVYVGHPLMDRLSQIRPSAPRRAMPVSDREHPRVVVLPGSRRSEVDRLMDLFGGIIARLTDRMANLDVVLPAVSHLRSRIELAAARWPCRPIIVEGEAAKLASFRAADAALAASGTVTLELALAGVPHVIAYKLDGIGRQLRRFVHAQPGLEAAVPMVSAGLPNILVAAVPGQEIIEDPRAMRDVKQAPTLPVPEFLDEAAVPLDIADALTRLLLDSAERRRQLHAFETIERFMALPEGQKSSEAAAAALLAFVARRGVHR